MPRADLRMVDVPSSPNISDQSVADYFANLDINLPGVRENSGIGKARNLTVKGVQAEQDQRDNLELAITTALQVKGAKNNDNAVLALIDAIIQESVAHNYPQKKKGGPSGVLQVIPSTAVSHHVDPRDIEAVTKEFMTHGFAGAGGAISLSQKNRNMSPGDIAAKVQAPQASALGLYQQWTPEARKWLAAVRGGRISGGDTTYRKQFRFERRKKENSWDAIQRLAEDVRWRCFPLGRVLYYMSETDLFSRRLAYTVTPDDDAIIELTYDIDWRAKVPANEAVLTVNLERWGAPPGYPVALDGFGPPDGRWLIISVSRDWFSNQAEVTLRQPLTPGLEPAPDPADRSPTGGEQDGSGITLYRKCRQISDAKPPYVYGGSHGVPLSSINSKDGMDCSSSVSLALYRAKLWDHTAIARTSGQFNTWGRKGRGSIFTVCYSPQHVYIRFEPGAMVDAKRFDTSGWGCGGSGPRLRMCQGRKNDEGMSLRHWPDM